MKLRNLGLGLCMAVVSVIPACAHSVKPVKPVAAAVAKPKDALTLKIEEEGRKCLGRIRECEQDFFTKEPYASKEEAAAACEEVKTTCLEDAQNRLMAEQN